MRYIEKVGTVYEFQNIYELLSEFHQDWSFDYPNEDSLVKAYVVANRDDPRCKPGALLCEIKELLALEQTKRDSEIDYLLKSTQCACVADQSPAAWLDHVAILVADALVTQPDDAAKMDWYSNRRTSLQSGLGNINDIIRLNPRNAQSYLRRGQIYFELGSVSSMVDGSTSADAAKAFINAINDYDTALSLDEKIASEALLARGSACMALHNYEQAISDFDRAIRVGPSCRGYAWLAEAYRAAGNLDASITTYSKVIEISQLPDLAYCARGYAYAQIGQYDSAVEDFSRAIGLTRHLGLAYHLRADVYRKLGSDELAAIDQQMASKLFYRQDPSWKLTDDWINWSL